MIIYRFVSFYSCFRHFAWRDGISILQIRQIHASWACCLIEVSWEVWPVRLEVWPVRVSVPKRHGLQFEEGCYLVVG